MPKVLLGWTRGEDFRVWRGQRTLVEVCRYYVLTQHLPSSTDLCELCLLEGVKLDNIPVNRIIEMYVALF